MSPQKIPFLYTIADSFHHKTEVVYLKKHLPQKKTC